MNSHRHILAAHRFGYGARPNLPDRSVRDIRDVLLNELANGTQGNFSGMANTRELSREYMNFRQARKKRRREAARKEPEDFMSGMAMRSKNRKNNVVRGIYRTEVFARVDAALASDYGFHERMVQFWSNLFTVAGRNARLKSVVGAFEREAIRPHLTGSFEEMLLTVESHPAMLTYLNNNVSFGPNSRAGQRRGRGRNENLAREILELHTLGVEGGYTQDDVIGLANILTGWSVQWKDKTNRRGRHFAAGTFRFKKNAHEPGGHRLLDQLYSQPDVEQGRAALRDIAHHRSTAQNIALRMARHFISDQPGRETVSRLARAFRRSRGQLMPVYEELLSLRESFEPELTKIRTPYEFVLATARAFELTSKDLKLFRILRLLGQSPFQAPSPQGWSDDSESWAAPDAIKTRLDWVQLLARRRLPIADVEERARTVLGPLLADLTLETLQRAESEQQAAVLFLMSPEFQRR